jgi:hypothetical protein
MSRESHRRIGLRWGVALGAFLVLYGVLVRALELSYKSAWSWLFYLALLLFGYLALRSATRRGLPTNFRQAFLLVLLTATVGSAIYSVYVFAYNRFVDDSLVREVRDDLIESSLATTAEGEAEQRRRIEAFTSPGFFAIGVFLRQMTVGLLAAVILGWRHAAQRLEARAGPPAGA